jgi:hypothetical protein
MSAPILPNSADAEDVFQATWLVLIRKAATLVGHNSVAGFLYEVTHNLAVNLKIEAVRRRGREKQAYSASPADPLVEITGKGATKTMFVSKLKVGLAFTIALGLLSSGAVVMSRPVLEAKEQETTQSRTAQPKQVSLIKHVTREKVGDPEKPPMSLEQVKTKLKEHRDKIKSLHLISDFESESPVGWELVKEWKVHGWQGPEKHREEVAVKGDKRYHRAGLQGEEAEHHIHVYEGDMIWHKMPFYVIDKPTAMQHIFNSYYLSVVGLLYPDPTKVEAEQKADRTYLLPEALEAPGYRVKGVEELEGTKCLVVEGKGTIPRHPLLKDDEVQYVTDDSLWLDLEHGMTLRKREFLKNGHVLRRVRTTNLKEILPGYWLPLECQDESLAPENAPKEYKGKPAIIVRFKVRKWEVNDVKDDFFALPKDVKATDLRDRNDP